MFRYDDNTHTYTLDGKVIPSLTQMLSLDGWSDHLKAAPAAVVAAKAEWGTELHNALSYVEHGFDDLITPEYEPHCKAWMTACRRMGWINPLPIWEKAELPALGRFQGIVWGFTPDRVSPKAVVEIKGTYSPHASHSIQTALQVIGMGVRKNDSALCLLLRQDRTQDAALMQRHADAQGQPDKRVRRSRKNPI